MYEVGNRPGHYRAFISLLRNAASWQTATKVYGNINVPVLLVWAIRIGPNRTSATTIAALLRGHRW
jgi:hypothetical protein